jgi:hypothetical protein
MAELQSSSLSWNRLPTGIDRHSMGVEGDFKMGIFRHLRDDINHILLPDLNLVS